MDSGPGCCEGCSVDFAVTNWKKNCDFCGKQCCSKCITGRNSICEDCLLAQSARQALSLQEDLDVKDTINLLLKQELKNKVEQVERFKQYLLEFDSLFVKDVIGDKTHLLMKVDFTDIENDIDELIDKSANNIRIIAEEMKSLNESRESTVSLLSQLNDRIKDLENQNLELANRQNKNAHGSQDQSFDMDDDFELNILRNQVETYKARCEALESQILSIKKGDSRSSTEIFVLTPNLPHRRRSRWFCFKCPLFS